LESPVVKRMVSTTRMLTTTRSVSVPVRTACETYTNFVHPQLDTQPEDIFDIYKTLSEVSQYFSIAAGFGNVHGVYKPGNVKLRPELLQKHQQFVKEQVKSKDDKPVFLVFHGGSGSSVDDFRQAISYGVVKVNLDTDMQWAYLSGVRDYVLNKKVSCGYMGWP
jgi:fructose/tagatose bisphosphate aldolase